MTDTLDRLLRQLRPQPRVWHARVQKGLIDFIDGLDPCERNLVIGWSNTMNFRSPLVTVERVRGWLTNRDSGSCAICGVHAQDTTERKLHLDHDHQNGAPRDLLCSYCNTKRVPAHEDAFAGNAQRYVQHWRNQTDHCYVELSNAILSTRARTVKRKAEPPAIDPRQVGLFDKGEGKP